MGGLLGGVRRQGVEGALIFPVEQGFGAPLQLRLVIEGDIVLLPFGDARLVEPLRVQLSPKIPLLGLVQGHGARLLIGFRHENLVPLPIGGAKGGRCFLRRGCRRRLHGQGLHRNLPRLMLAGFLQNLSIRADVHQGGVHLQGIAVPLGEGKGVGHLEGVAQAAVPLGRGGDTDNAGGHQGAAVHRYLVGQNPDLQQPAAPVFGGFQQGGGAIGGCFRPAALAMDVVAKGGVGGLVLPHQHIPAAVLYPDGAYAVEAVVPVDHLVQCKHHAAVGEGLAVCCHLPLLQPDLGVLAVEFAEEIRRLGREGGIGRRHQGDD